MYSNTILKLDLIIIIIQKYCFKYLKPDKDISKKSKTIQFVLDQLNDIRKTKDFKTLKSIFTIEKNYKIKDLKDWLGILCVNKPGLFSKHFKLDVEIDMTRGYRTYVNLLTKLGNNKTKVDLKESNKKISILFNLLFCNIIVGGMVFRTKPASNKEEKKTFNSFFALQQTKKIDKKHEETHQKKLIKIKKNYDESTATGKRRWRAIVITKLILRSLEEKYGPEFARETKLSMSLQAMLFQDARPHWLSVDTFKQSLKDPVPRPYDKIYPIVQQSYIGSCWINSILVALMYPYYLKEEFLNIIILLLTEREQNLQQQQTPSEINKASFARIIQDHLRELLVLQYGRNFNMTGKECIRSELSFVSDFIKQLTDIAPDIFSDFSQVKNQNHPNKKLNDIILNEGGTTEDIFKLINILLENGFKFTQVAESDSIQFYEKQVGNKIIRICVAPKQAYSHFQHYIQDGFQFASIILFNTKFPDKSSGHSEDTEIAEMSGMLENSMEEEKNSMEEEKKSMEEEKPAGHVITLVTDNNRKLFFYNGWIYNNCVNSLQPTNGKDIIEIKTEENEKLYFDLFNSFGIMILFKVEPVS